MAYLLEHALLRGLELSLRMDTSVTETCTFRRLTMFILVIYEGWNFNSGNYLFTTDTK